MRNGNTTSNMPAMSPLITVNGAQIPLAANPGPPDSGAPFHPNGCFGDFRFCFSLPWRRTSFFAGSVYHNFPAKTRQNHQTATVSGRSFLASLTPLVSVLFPTAWNNLLTFLCNLSYTPVGISALFRRSLEFLYSRIPASFFERTVIYYFQSYLLWEEAPTCLPNSPPS